MSNSLRSAALAAPILLAACVSPSTPTSAPVTPAVPTYSTSGLEGVMGRSAHMLEEEFGRPDLDIREGDARKLQFSSRICVLDAYLYPPSQGKEAVVRYVDARLPDGRDFDRASCVAALSRREQAR